MTRGQVEEARVEQRVVRREGNWSFAADFGNSGIFSFGFRLRCVRLVRTST